MAAFSVRTSATIRLLVKEIEPFIRMIADNSAFAQHSLSIERLVNSFFISEANDNPFTSYSVTSPVLSHLKVSHKLILLIYSYRVLTRHLPFLQ